MCEKCISVVFAALSLWRKVCVVSTCIRMVQEGGDCSEESQHCADHNKFASTTISNRERRLHAPRNQQIRSEHEIFYGKIKITMPKMLYYKPPLKSTQSYQTHSIQRTQPLLISPPILPTPSSTPTATPPQSPQPAPPPHQPPPQHSPCPPPP